MIRFPTQIIAFIFVVASLALIGCVELSNSNFNSGSVIELRNALIDKGAMRIDPSNPYLAAAQLLNSEKNVSQSLSGFLSIRGQPTALEVEKDKASKLTLKLYYTDLFERYELTSTDSDWVIAGPFPDQSVPRAFNETPTITPNKPQATPTALVKFWGATPTPTVAPSPIPTILNQIEPNTIDTVTAEPTVSVISASTDSTTTVTPQDLAEVSPRGDVVHYVTFPGETISIISRWYTGERENASKIARLNRMKNADTLQIGDSVVIPSYMVKNKNRLTEANLVQIQSIITHSKEN